MRVQSICLLALFPLLFACGSGEAPIDENTDDDTETDSDVDSDGDGDAGSDSGTDPSVCGDGVPEGDEACDDGNLVSGDGCNSTCTMNDAWDVVANASTEGDQRQPALSCGEDRVVLAFSDWSGQDTSGAGVKLRFFGSDGMPEDNVSGGDEELIANTTVVDHQREPRVALLPDGTFVSVWTDDSNSAATGSDVRLRVFQPDGDALLPDALASLSDLGDQATPAVAASDDGEFLVVWVDDGASGPDADGFGIKGRLFDGDGTPIVNGQTGDDGEFQINQVTAGNQIQPDVAWAGGWYLVVWTDGSGMLDGDGFGVVGTALGGDGAFVGPLVDTLINTTTAGMQATPRVAYQPDLGAVVVWTDDSQAEDAVYYGVRGRLIQFDLAGRQNDVNDSLGDFQINTVFDAGQQMPALAVMPDGPFAVAWQDWSAEDGSGAGIRARSFSETAAPLANDLAPEADDFEVNTTYWNAQITPVICATGSWYFAAWEDQSGDSPDESGAAVRYRLLPGP